KETPWALYRDVFVHGGMKRVLNRRDPGADEPRVRMPTWALERAVQDGELFAERIVRSGVRVVGMISALYSDPPTSEADASWSSQIDQAIAVEALAGAFVGARRAEADALSKNGLRKALDAAIAERDEARRCVPAPGSNSVRRQVAHLSPDERGRAAAASFTT